MPYGTELIPYAQRMLQILGPRGLALLQAAQRGATKGGELMESGIPGMSREVPQRLLTGPAGALAAKGAQSMQNGMPTANFDAGGAALAATTGLLGKSMPQNGGAASRGPQNIPAGLNAPIMGADGMPVAQDRSGAAIPMNQQGANYNDMDNVKWEPPSQGAPTRTPAPRVPEMLAQPDARNKQLPPGMSATGLNEDQMRMLMGGLEGAPGASGPINPMPGNMTANGLTEADIRRLIGGLL